MGLSEVITYISNSLLIATGVLEGLGILKTTIFFDNKISCIQDFINIQCSSFTFTKAYMSCFWTSFFNIKIDTIIFFNVVNLVVVISVASYIILISAFMITFVTSLVNIARPLVQKILGFMMMINVFLISIIILEYATVYASDIYKKMTNKVETEFPDSKSRSSATLYAASALSFICSLSYFYNPIRRSSSRRDSEDDDDD